MDREMRHLIIPIKKVGDSYRAILSDDSLDRDGEYIASSLIEKWASQGLGLPMLANHDNSMQSFIGGWTNRTVVTNGTNTALQMTPNFFSADANPLSQQIKKQIDEATAMGIDVGTSIGFIPEIGIKTARGYEHQNAELVEASIVPVQSNRNAYVTLAKKFNLSTDTLKKGADIIGAGGNVTDETSNQTQDNKDAVKAPTPEEMIAALDAKVNEMQSRLAAMEQAMAAEASQGNQAPADTAKQLEEFKLKLAEREAKEKIIADQLAAYEQKFEEMKKNVESPKGKVPAEMRGNSGVSKDPLAKDEEFNATKAWMKTKGIDG